MPYSSAPVALGRPIKTVLRARLWYLILMVIFSVFLVRLFYLQIIRQDYYKQSAAIGHLKQYDIPADRGTIEAHSGSSVVPIVLNQTLYTIYADPTLIKDPGKVAETLSSIFKGRQSDYEGKLKTKDTRYVILARKASKDQQQKLLAKKYPGVGAQEQQYRTYPDGSLASQLLGFVNNDGSGEYGLEQSLNSSLAGKAGELKAVTDVHGVPLAANTGNILNQPVAGSNVTLTIDVAMQKQLEDILKAGLQHAKSDSGSAIIMDPNTGAVKAMANWPTYDPANYSTVEDGSVFNNAAVSAPLEVGSIMKSLTAAAALNQGVIQPNSTYYDPSHYTIDDFTVRNIEEDGGPGVKSIENILNLSLNTGATWMLMKMGGSDSQITQQGRQVWYDYMTNHYMFGKKTGIEQGYEAGGTIPDPNNGYARNLTYANTAFGQAMTATPLQMAAALSAVLNGGIYYKPHLVDYTIDANGNKVVNTPLAVKKDVVSPQVSQELQSLLEEVVNGHSFTRRFDQKTYSVGGKTGTAQLADPKGGYYDNIFNGTYMGFVGGDSPQYVIMVSVNKPKIGGYAGTQAAQPIFGDLAHMLLDKFNVVPKTK